jgi:capsular polysaccharide biosynthesis protein
MAEDARLVGRSKIWRDPHENVCSEDLYRIKRILSRDRDFSVYHFWRTGGKRLEGAYLSLGGVWNSRPNYFHWLTDGLTRLALEASLPERPRILLPSWRASFLDETLELLALKDRCEFHQEACLRPERFYYCAPTSMTGAYNPMGWSWLRQQFEPYFLSRKINRRIFFTRRSATRVPGDLKKIEALFESRDFEIVDCGEIPVRKQIEIASEASAIAGFHGAAMTNLLWSTEGIPVLEIFESSHLNACYEQIAFERGLDYSMHIREEHAHSHRFFAEWLESHLG